MVLKEVMFETLGDVTLYYREALEKDAWSLQEAAFIVTGNLPVPKVKSAEEMCNDYPIAAGIMSEALKGCLGEVLKSRELGGTFYVSPGKFLEWVAKKGWEFPEMLSEIMKEKGFVFPKKKSINKNTEADHKRQVQELGKKISIRLERSNQAEIYRDAEMQALLKGLMDPYGGKRKPYTEGTVKRWLSEFDERPPGTRRGRPKGS